MISKDGKNSNENYAGIWILLHYLTTICSSSLAMKRIDI